MSRDSLTSILKSGPAMVVTTLLALGVVAGVGWKARDLVTPAHAEVATAAQFAALQRELEENRKTLDATNLRLDQFNTRLSWLEGATSGALKAPDVRASGVGR